MAGSLAGRVEMPVAKVYGVEHLVTHTKDVIEELAAVNVKLAVVVDVAPSTTLTRSALVCGVFDADVLTNHLADVNRGSAIEDLGADAIDTYKIMYRRNTIRVDSGVVERSRNRGARAVDGVTTYALAPTGIQLAGPTFAPGRALSGLALPGITLPGFTTRPSAPQCDQTPHDGWSRFRCTASDRHMWWCLGAAAMQPCPCAASTGGKCPGVLERY